MIKYVHNAHWGSCNLLKDIPKYMRGSLYAISLDDNIIMTIIIHCLYTNSALSLSVSLNRIVETIIIFGDKTSSRVENGVRNENIHFMMTKSTQFQMHGLHFVLNALCCFFNGTQSTNLQEFV